jgi:uncharacterized membrane protein YeaQ/YmgE (transglycosylase-associated protein family)
MTILTVIIVGAIVGWLASRLMGRDEGIIASILIGIVGSFIGSFISTLFTGSDRSYLAFSWSGFFWSLIGAIILVAIMNAMSSRRHHPTV